jgi:hypothetical protein
VSANLPKRAHPKIKAWPSRLGLGHEADELILEKMINVKKPKKGSQGKTYWAVMLKKKKVRSSLISYSVSKTPM